MSEKIRVAFPVGLKVTDVRWITTEEMEQEGWESRSDKTAVLIFNDGSRVYASCDYEGNDCGALFGYTADNTPVVVEPLSAIDNQEI